MSSAPFVHCVSIAAASKSGCAWMRAVGRLSWLAPRGGATAQAGACLPMVSSATSGVVSPGPWGGLRSGGGEKVARGGGTVQGVCSGTGVGLGRLHVWRHGGAWGRRSRPVTRVVMFRSGAGVAVAVVWPASLVAWTRRQDYCRVRGAAARACSLRCPPTHPMCFVSCRGALVRSGLRPRGVSSAT